VQANIVILVLVNKEVAWSLPRSGRFTPEIDQVPIVQETGWAPDPVWTCAKNLAPPGFDLRTVQPVVIRYTDWATWPTKYVVLDWFIQIH
jgi:hypothetical protein